MRRITPFIAFLALPAIGFGQSITLRLNLPMSKSFAYAVTTKIKSAGGMALTNADLTQAMTTTMKALSKNAQGTKVQMKVTGVKITTTSTGPMAEQMKNSAKSLEGSTTESVYDSRGQVVSATDGPRVMSVGGMGVGFMGVLFAAGPVSPGATWSSAVDFEKIFSNMGRGMIQTGKNKTVPIKYKLVRVQRLGTKTLAHITYDMKGNLDLSIGTGQGQPMPMKVQVAMKGQFVVDASSGLPREGKSGGTTKMTISGMEITQTIATSFRLK